MSTRCSMWFLAMAVVLAAAAFASLAVADASSSPPPGRHEQWMAEYGRKYDDDAEREHRRQVFDANLAYIEASNRVPGRKYRLAVNQFADMTNAEFRLAHATGYNATAAAGRDKRPTPFRYENSGAAPRSIDWRARGAVTPVKNQLQCGCCWAFSAVAAMEGMLKINTKKLISFSEQELLDCDVNGDDQGCDGGTMDGAFQFIVANALASEGQYPYTGSQGSCDASASRSPAGTIGGYEDVPSNNETALRLAVAGQPVSVAIDGGGMDFQFYSGGVFGGSCGTDLDHAVAVVGYGADAGGTPFWLAKNSWGREWGEGGYVRMKRDIGSPEGLCGLAMQPSYPTPFEGDR